MMKLFGGIIGWRASKQAIVTTSTIEAELLSLAQAIKEALYISRLITELGVTLDLPTINMWYNNQQTIHLVYQDIATLQTKLCHVDIHNHWLCEAIQTGRIRVSYMPIAEILANGLTKARTIEKFKAFRRLIGLVDIEDRIKARKLKEITEYDLDIREDLLPGGEAI